MTEEYRVKCVTYDKRDLELFWEEFHREGTILHTWLKKNKLRVRGQKDCFVVERIEDE